MALPKLNNAPKYEMKIPSSKESVTYRPFLVKEEKVLLMALESKDPTNTFHALFDTINSCVITKNFKEHELTPYDVEYMFLQIRAKSVGESSKIGLKCSNCETENEVVIDLTKVEVSSKGENESDIIKLNDDISLKMKTISFKDAVLTGEKNKDLSEIDQIMKILAQCMDSVMTADASHKLSDESEEEVIEFIESLSSQQFEKIKDWVENIPQLRHNIKFKCKECGTDNEREVTGITNFFS